MIEKINLDKRKSFGRLDWLEHWNEPSGAKLIEEKINELVDAVNILQPAKDAMFYTIRNIQNRIAALDDPTYHETEPEPTENVPGPIKLYVCADGSVYGNEDVAKSHAASISNQLPAVTTTTDRVYLEQELDHTRKALDVAKSALKEQQRWLGVIRVSLISHLNNEYGTAFKSYDADPTVVNVKRANDILNTVINEITELEQKDEKK